MTTSDDTPRSEFDTMFERCETLTGGIRLRGPIDQGCGAAMPFPSQSTETTTELPLAA